MVFVQSQAERCRKVVYMYIENPLNVTQYISLSPSFHYDFKHRLKKHHRTRATAETHTVNKVLCFPSAALFSFFFYCLELLMAENHNFAAFIMKKKCSKNDESGVEGRRNDEAYPKS